MVNFCFKRNTQIKKNKVKKIQKLKIYFEPWHIRKPDIFIIRGIFRTLKYSKILRYLHPCQSKRSFLDHFRCLTIWQDSKYTHFLALFTQVLLSLYIYCRFCFRHIQIYSSIIQEHNTKYIQTTRYIHNTILNIFTRAPSWTFDTVLNASFLYKWSLTSRVT